MGSHGVCAGEVVRAHDCPAIPSPHPLPPQDGTKKEEKGKKQELWGISEFKGKTIRHLGQPGAEGTVSHLLN